MAAALEQEVAVAERAGSAEQRLGAGGDRRRAASSRVRRTVVIAADSTPAGSPGPHAVSASSRESPSAEVRVHVGVRGGHRAHGPCSDDRLPHAAVRQPDPDEACQQLVGRGPAFCGVADRRRLERVARSRPQVRDVPREPVGVDGGAHPAGEPGTEPLRVRVRVGGQDLGHHGAGSRHRERVAEDRAAGGNEVEPLPVRALALLEHGRDLVGRPPCPERQAARDGLADGDEVRFEAPLPHEPARSDHLRVRLVVGEERSGLAGERGGARRGTRPRGAAGRCCS